MLFGLPRPGRPFLGAALAAWLCCLAPPPVLALDPGRVQGRLELNGRAVALTQAYAHLHDNAEKVLARPRELRLLLADREVPQTALAGLPPLPVEIMAREGRVQGLLLKLDPDDPRQVELTLLSVPSAPGQQLQSLTVTPAAPVSPGARTRVKDASHDQKTCGPDSPQPVLELKIHSQRLGGSFTCPSGFQTEAAARTGLACSLRFSMPLFHELPVTAVFTGRAAHTSPQAQVLRSLARALEQEDFTAVSRFATAPACQQLQTRAAADPGSWAKNRAAELQACLPQLRRVVVRGQRATAVFANRQPHTFLQEGGEWKIAE